MTSAALPPGTTPELEHAWDRRYLDRAALVAVGADDPNSTVDPAVRTAIRGWAARSEHDLATVLQLCNDALAVLPEENIWRVRAYLGQSACLADLGLRDEALLANEAALVAAEAVGALTERASALHDRAGIYLDDPGRCEAYLREALRLSREIGDPGLEALATMNLSELLPDDPETSDDALARAGTMAQPVRPGLAATILVMRVAHRLDESDVEGAQALFDSMVMSPDDAVETTIEVSDVSARLALAHGDAERAVEILDTALVGASPFQRLQLLEPLSEALEQVGDLRRALATERALRAEAAEFHQGERTRQGMALEVHYATERAAADAARERERTALLAEQVADLETQADRLRESSLRDALTGLHNRRALEEFTAALAATDETSGQVAALDLDGFKHLNDTLGHDAGDEALRIVADVLESVARLQDCLVRTGGDEFVLVRPEPPRPADGEMANGSGDLDADLRAVVPTLRTRVAEALGPEVALGASIGADRFERSTAEEITAALTRADNAMYAAKRQLRRRSTDTVEA